MKRQIFFIILFFLFFLIGHSQNTKQLVYKAYASKDSSDYYFKLAKKSIKTPADEAEYYFGKNARCNAYNQHDSCVYYGLIAIEKFKKIGNFNSQYSVYNNIASSYKNQGQYEKAINFILKGLKLAENENNEYWLTNFNTNISLNYHDFESYSKGIYYGKKALNYGLNSNTKDVKSITLALNAIAINFDDWNLPDSALFYHKKVFDYVKGKDTLSISHTYNNIGNTLLKQKKYLEAEKWIKRAINIEEENSGGIKDANYYYQGATHYSNLATIAYRLNDYEAAEKWFDKAFYFAENSNNAEKLRDYYQLRYVFNKQRNNLEKTVEYQEKYIQLRDSVFEKERAIILADLETKYQTEKKEKLLLQKEVEVKQKNSLLIGISLLTFFISILGFLIYRQQKLKTIQQEQEFELKAAIVQIENQTKLQEQRLEISRDLHDNIGSQLTFIISSVDNIKYAFKIQNSKLEDKLNTISNFAKSTITELRDTIWAMNKTTITFEDLKSRVAIYIENAKIASKGIKFNFNIHDDFNQTHFSATEGMNIFRIIQEAINNALKHANANQITVDVYKKGDSFLIDIEDDGKGFDTEMVDLGNGLSNMNIRAKELNGNIKITTKEKFGTKISLVLKK